MPPNADSPRITGGRRLTTTPPPSNGSTCMVPRNGDTAPDLRPGRSTRAVADASLYLPDARRTWTWLSIRCPFCHQVHLGRVRTPEQAGRSAPHGLRAHGDRRGAAGGGSMSGHYDGAAPHPRLVAELLELSDERDRWLRRELAAERRGYLRGQAEGYEAGYRQGAADCDAHWMWCLAPARRAAGHAARNPTADELDRRRYPPDGRLSWLRRPESGRGAA